MLPEIDESHKHKEGSPLNKFTGLELLVRAGIPTPRIFSSIDEGNSESARVLSRGFDMSGQDNLCIDVFPTQTVATAAQVETNLVKIQKLIKSQSFSVFANQYGIDEKKIDPKLFLHEQIGIPGVNSILAVTADMPNGEVLVNVRNTQSQTSGRFIRASQADLANTNINIDDPIPLKPWINIDAFIKQAVALHYASNQVLGGNVFHQYEMAGSVDLKQRVGRLFLVQAKEMLCKSSNQIVYAEDTNGIQNQMDKSFDVVATDFSAIDHLQYRVFGVKKETPYILIITKQPSPRGRLKMDLDYGNLRGIIFSNPTLAEGCLAHDTYKLMTLAWLRGGSVGFVRKNLPA